MKKLLLLIGTLFTVVIATGCGKNNTKVLVCNGNKRLSNYSSIYKELAKILNAHTSKLYILPEVLTYQKLLKGFKLDKKVKDFYQL